MIPTENISLTHEHYDLCVLPRPRSQPCWYLHVEFPSNLGNKMVPPDCLASPPYIVSNETNTMTMYLNNQQVTPISVAKSIHILAYLLFIDYNMSLIYKYVHST